MNRPQRHAIRLIAAILLAWGAGLAPAAAEALVSPPSLMLKGPAAEPPKLDGQLDDACWRESAQTTGFVLSPRREPAAEQTTVYVTYDQRTLYVAFECLEAGMDRIAADITERDSQVTKDDSVTLFLDPNHDRFTYYQFSVNTRGARLDVKGDAAGADARWDAPWDARVTRGDDRWWVEMAIPFSSLDIQLGRTTDTWGINFVRHEKPSREESAWAPAESGAARPELFGRLSGLNVDFSRYAYAIDVAQVGESLVGNNVVKVNVTGPFPGPALVGLDTYLPDGQVQRKQVSVTLDREEPATAMLPYTLPREGFYRMVVRVRDPLTQDTLHATGVSVQVPPLLQVAIYPNHYRQEVWVRPRLNVRESDLKEFRLTVRLLRNGTLVPPVREKPFFSVKEPTIPFDLSRSGPGEYEVQLALLPKRSGSGLVRESVKFAVAPRSGNPTPPVSLQAENAVSDNSILVRGRRFFPLGIADTGGLDEPALRDLHDSGFNLVQVPLSERPEDTRAILDRAHAHSLMAWVPLGGLLDLKDGDVEKRKVLQAASAELARHPALLCWGGVDEPAWRGCDAEGVVRGYQALRSFDPDHPVWTIHAPHNSIDELALFNRATDIAGAAIYPVPEPQTHSDMPNKSISVVGDETRKNVLAVLNRKPVFMVLQGFAWGEMARRAGGSEAPIYPTIAQLRFMAYDAVVRGARGLVWAQAPNAAVAAPDASPRTLPFWNDLRSVVYELSQMRDVLAGPDTDDAVTVPAGGKSIEWLVRRHPETKDRFIFVVNTSPKPVNAQVQIPGAMSKVAWRVLFERRTVVGNPIVDHFDPYEVHIYTAATSFPPERFLNTR